MFMGFISKSSQINNEWAIVHSYVNLPDSLVESSEAVKVLSKPAFACRGIESQICWRPRDINCQREDLGYGKIVGK
jgi:hypothetical protein